MSNTKFLPIKKEDIQGIQAVIVDIDETIEFNEFWEKSHGKVYRYTKIGNGKWVKTFIPFMTEIPFTYAKL